MIAFFSSSLLANCIKGNYYDDQGIIKKEVEKYKGG
ncbi:MAG: hypothetical protein ACJAYN_003202 [Bermanella sp.]|jgi:hypothetical protein